MVAYVDDRKGHDRRYSLDDSAVREMGYAPQIPFADGLKDTVRWYQENRRWWQTLKELEAIPADEAAPEGPLNPARRRRGTWRRKVR
jgi:dTDP-glucose 4,6-dehydratase